METITSQDLVNGNCRALVLWHFEIFKNAHRWCDVYELSHDFAAGINYRVRQFGESPEGAAATLANANQPEAQTITKRLTSKDAAHELRKSDERCDWCALEGYSHGDVEITLTTREREEFEECTGIHLESDVLTKAEFSAITKFFKL